MHVYCLFCQTNRCGPLSRHLSVLLNCRVIRARLVQRKWIKGVATREEHDYLPGYLFVYSPVEMTDTVPILKLDGVIRCLGTQDLNGIFHFTELSGNDLKFAELLLESDGLIDNVKVYEVGDRLVPAGGLLAGMEGRIVKVDRHRERLLMAYEFDGQHREIWVGFDVIEEKKKLIGE